MTETKMTGLELAVELDKRCSNDWGGNDPTEELAAARFAVVIDRADDAYVVAAKSWDEVAYALFGTYGQEYGEWVSEVWDMVEGHEVAFETKTTIEIIVGGRAVARVRG